MRVLSRFVFICNLCFVASVFMRLVEISQHSKSGKDVMAPLNLATGSVVVLGWIAVFLNIFFILLFLARFASKKMNNIPRWIVYFNIIILPMQIYYYFFSKF